MRTLLGVPIAAVMLAAVMVNTGYASCCGAASYKHVSCTAPADYGSAKQHCYTVMKTCRETVYEQQQYTCYKKAYETVYETKTIDVC
jgi:hypothetical protein